MIKSVGGNMTTIKIQNRALILNTIKRMGAVSRIDIAQILQLTPAAITILVNDMIKEGIIREAGSLEEEDKRSGRKKVLIDINYDHSYIIGINIGRNSANIGVANINGDIIDDRRMAVDSSRTPEDLMKAISRECVEILWKENISKDKLLGVGVGIVGPVDKQRGVSKRAYGLWKEEVPVRGLLEGCLDTRVVVDNNVRALALGEIDSRTDKDMSNAFFIKYGPGVGSALIVNNEIYYGSDNSSGEIGHTIVDYGGEACRCGRRGCLETVASLEALIERIKAIFSLDKIPRLYGMCAGSIDNLDINKICRAAEQGDEEVLEIMKKALYYMAIAIGNAVSIYDPGRVILYGEAFGYRVIMDEFNRYMKECIGDRDLGSLIAISEQSHKSNYTGGIALALREFFYNTGGM